MKEAFWRPLNGGNMRISVPHFSLYFILGKFCVLAIVSLSLLFSEVGGTINGFSGSGNSGRVKSLRGFLEECLRDSISDLDPILKGLYEELRGSVMKDSAFRNFQVSLRALLFLVRFPIGAKSLVSHAW